MTSLPLYHCHPGLYLTDLLRYYFTSCLAAFLLNLSGCTRQTVVRITILFYSIRFVRLGLKIISGDFEEDLTKIVGVSFQRFFDKTGNNRKSIQPKIGAIERRIRLDPRNPMVPHF